MAVVYTTTGKIHMVDRIDQTEGVHTDYIGSATDPGSAFNAGHNTFAAASYTEASEARAAATKSQPASDKNQWLATQLYTGTKTITAAAVFSALTSGDMMLAADSLSIAVTAGTSVQYTFTLQQT